MEWHHDDDSVWYDLLAFSRPNQFLTRVGYPFTRRCHAVLQELDPPPILEAHRGRVMGYDYEKAWKEIARRHDDLRDLSQAEFYLRYFKEPFVEGFWKVQKGQG